MTLAAGSDIQQPPVYTASMQHQQPELRADGGPGGAFTPLPMQFVWLFANDDSPTSAYSLWGHVAGFTPSTGEGTPDTGLKHNYLVMQPHLDKNTIVMSFSGGASPPTRTWLPFGWSGARSIAAPVRWLWVGVGSNGAFPVSQEADTAEFAGSEFAPDALAVLDPVARGTAELIIGDDVVWGLPFMQATIPAVIVQKGTTTFLGALQATGTTTTSFARCISTTGFCDPPAPPPDLRALDARAGVLYSLHAESAGATLTSVDVRSALADAPLSFTLHTFGASPVAPMAMAWHFAEHAVYVLDAVHSGHRRALRLLRISPAGASVELWRTRAVGNLPQAFISVDMSGQIIVSLNADEAEIAAIGRTGIPVSSKHVDGRLKRAAVGSLAGFSLPLERRAHDTKSDLEVLLIERRHTAQGVCGAPWLRAHADRGSNDPLAVAARACGGEDGDDRRGEDGDENGERR